MDCFDGTTFGRTVYMTAFEERRLRNVLAALHDFGFILRASFEPARVGYGFGDVIEYLGASIGAPFAEAALAAGGRSAASIEPAPATVMPVWAFTPEGGGEDVMLGSAKLWNTDLLVEALRVEDDDPTSVPVRPVGRCGGQGPEPVTIRLPGRGGSYVVFAAAAPG